MNRFDEGAGTRSGSARAAGLPRLIVEVCRRADRRGRSTAAPAAALERIAGNVILEMVGAGRSATRADGGCPGAARPGTSA